MAIADLVALVLLAIACVRGLFLGLTREVCSLAALAGACLAVRYLTDPASDLLLDTIPVELSPGLAHWVAAAAVAVAAAALVALLGRALRRGIRAAGLGAADRFAGGVLGLAEGGVIIAVAIALLLATVGRNHELLEHSQALSIYDRAHSLASPQLRRAIDVAAPPPPQGR